MKCKTCKDLSTEKRPVEVEGVKTYDGGYFNWSCVIVFCPTCGKKIEYSGK